MKVFGPDDNDALKCLSKVLAIDFVSADHRGFDITKKRIVDDIQFPLSLVAMKDRLNWIESKCSVKDVIYMGDGWSDHKIFQTVGYSIAPNDAFSSAINAASYVTTRRGGDRAVAEAVVHIVETFFSQERDALLTHVTE